jgi:hypothetical protein
MDFEPLREPNALATSAEGTGLLERRMSVLGLAQTAIARTDPDIFDRLRGLCARCECRDLCKGDLRHQLSDRTWCDYCANAPLLNALTEVWWFRVLL